jgi:hypothetical protein
MVLVAINDAALSIGFVATGQDNRSNFERIEPQADQETKFCASLRCALVVKLIAAASNWPVINK